jgi:hypothetical protein
MRAISLVSTLVLALAGCGSSTPPSQGPPQEDAGPPPDEVAPTASADLVRHELVQLVRTVVVTAQDDVGVTRVTLEIDGTEVVEALAEPFALAWNSEQTPDGLHDVRAVAYDAAGNRGETEVVPVLVVNFGRLADYSDVVAEQGLIEGEFLVPADWNGNQELIDIKFHWDMPSGMTQAVAILEWPDPSAGWSLDFSIGTGWCPDSGIKAQGAIEGDGEIVLAHVHDGGELETGQWFVHVGARNASTMKGQGTLFTARVVYFP